MVDESFLLSWKDVTVSVLNSTKTFWKRNVKETTILDKACGQVKSGSLIAVIGPSGAGKTTLLAALSGRINRNFGTISINRKFLTNTELKNISGYLHQHFIVIETLTVKEHLTFMSALKLNSLQESITIIKLISELNLKSCIDTNIRNLSGGERKRLALAVELMNDPTILYCDEPTTGLDSTSATSIIEILRNKAVSGMMIITTIHQPSSQLYNYFDQIILLASGKLLFRGTKQQIRNFFNSLNLICPKNYNPPDFYIEQIIRISKNSVSIKEIELCSEKFIEKYEPGDNLNGLLLKLRNGFKKKHFCIEIIWLTWRYFIEAKRNYGYHIGHFALLVITAFMIAVVFSNVKMDDENSVQNYKGILFLITSELIFTHLYSVIYTFPEEYAVFCREESLYRNYSYFFSKIITIIPRSIIQPFVFLLIISLYVNFPFGLMFLTQVLFILSIGCVTASTMGLCISANFKTLEFMELFLMPLDLLSMLLAGILVKVNNITVYLRWIKYFSPFFYVYESISILQWIDVTEIVCSNKTNIPCYRNGKEVLTEMGFSTSYLKVMWNIFGLFLLSVCFSLFGYLGIVKKENGIVL